MDTLLESVPFREDGTIDINEMMRLGLERTVNAIMDAQADEMLGEGNRRNGYRERKLATVVGEIVMRIPKLREGSYFPDELIRPYSRVDRAVVATVKEAYVRGLSTRKIEKVADALDFASLSPSRVSRMTAELDEEVEALLSKTTYGAEFPYLWLDATYINCRDEGHVQSKGVVTAIACDTDGDRRFVGFGVVDTESAPSWKAFLKDLRRRGVLGVRCVVSDAHGGLASAIREVFNGAAWQRCIVHLERDARGCVRRGRTRQGPPPHSRPSFPSGTPSWCGRCSERPSTCSRPAPDTPASCLRMRRRTYRRTWTSPTSTTSACAPTTYRSVPTRRSSAAPRRSGCSRRQSRSSAWWARCS